MLYGVSSLQGGVETFVFNLIEHLDRNKFNLFLLVNIEDYIGKEWLESQDVVVIEGPNRRHNPFTYKNSLKGILRKNNIDIVWSNLTSLSDINLLQAAKEVGIPLRICYSHQSSNMGGRLTGLLHDFNKKFHVKKVATHYWACSDVAWDYFFKGVINRQNGEIFVNAVDPKKFAFNPIVRDKKRNELKVNGRFVLGTVGRLTHEKNQKFLIELVNNLKEEIPNIECLIIGSGPKEKELSKLINEYSLENEIRLLGQRTDVSEMLNAFDVFVLPSLFEGLPFVLVEAQMNGLDVVVSDQVSLESGFTDRINFLKLDINLWKEAILQIYNNFNRIGADKKQIAESEFNIYNNIKEFEDRLK